MFACRQQLFIPNVAVDRSCLSTSGRRLQTMVTGNDDQLFGRSMFGDQLFDQGIRIFVIDGIKDSDIMGSEIS